jgi:hypothetical protein
LRKEPKAGHAGVRAGAGKERKDARWKKGWKEGKKRAEKKAKIDRKHTDGRDVYILLSLYIDIFI